MSVLGLKISQLPLYDGVESPNGFLPIVINGVTYQISVSNLVLLGAVTSVNGMTGDVVISTGYSAIVTWDGVSTIPVPSGFSGKVLNFNNGTIVTYTVAGTALTVTGTASADDILIITSN